MLNSAFDAFSEVRTDYYPLALRAEIDRGNDLVYPNLNNGVYRAGFATSQAAYEAAAHNVFATLDWLEDLLSRQRYLAGRQITEADWRLFTTLIRFDAVYYSHFKCNVRRIADYSNLSNYLRELYQVPAIAQTVSIDHIKRHYYGSQRQVNPTGIVPIGPLLELPRRTTAAASARKAGAAAFGGGTCCSLTSALSNTASCRRRPDATATRKVSAPSDVPSNRCRAIRQRQTGRYPGRRSVDGRRNDDQNDQNRVGRQTHVQQSPVLQRHGTLREKPRRGSRRPALRRNPARH